MIEIDAWVAGGYKVRAFDWVDGKNIYLNICYYCPGSSLSSPPAADRSFLLPMDMESMLQNYLHSVVDGLMNTPSSPSKEKMEIVIPADDSVTNESSTGAEPEATEEQPESATKKRLPLRISRPAGLYQSDGASCFLRCIEKPDTMGLSMMKGEIDRKTEGNDSLPWAMEKGYQAVA